MQLSSAVFQRRYEFKVFGETACVTDSYVVVLIICEVVAVPSFRAVGERWFHSRHRNKSRNEASPIMHHRNAVHSHIRTPAAFFEPFYILNRSFFTSLLQHTAQQVTFKKSSNPVNLQRFLFPPLSSPPVSHLSDLPFFSPSSFIPLISPSHFDLQWFPSWLVAIETEPPRPPAHPLNVFCHRSREQTKKKKKHTHTQTFAAFSPLLFLCAVCQSVYILHVSVATSANHHFMLCFFFFDS